MRTVRPSPCTVAVLLLLLLLLLSAPPARAAEEPVATQVWEWVRAERATAGAPPLERRELLDQVARERAELVAGLPHAERLTVAEPISGRLSEAGVGLFRNVLLHLDMQRGYRFPASSLAMSWRKHATWDRVAGEPFDAIGLATAKADDGWLIFVVVLLEDYPVPDRAEVERGTVAAVNERRRQNGLEPLARRDWLDEIARAHSSDMAHRGYFDHRSPEGDEVAQRVAARGRGFLGVAENIHKSRGFEDMAATATASWMKSPAHRENILTPEFTLTGVGAFIDPEGVLYLTQVYMLPD